MKLSNECHTLHGARPQLNDMQWRQREIPFQVFVCSPTTPIDAIQMRLSMVTTTWPQQQVRCSAIMLTGSCGSVTRNSLWLRQSQKRLPRAHHRRAAHTKRKPVDSGASSNRAFVTQCARHEMRCLEFRLRRSVKTLKMSTMSSSSLRESFFFLSSFWFFVSFSRFAFAFYNIM